jgi:outer membrane murein-binding lipoprotein Lpp
MADEPESEGQAPSAAELDSKVDGLTEKVDALISSLHGGAQRGTQARLDAPGNIAQQVQEELDRRDRRAKAEDVAGQVGTLKETVAKLTEKTPEPPARRIERIMGWGR